MVIKYLGTNWLTREKNEASRDGDGFVAFRCPSIRAAGMLVGTWAGRKG